MTVERRWALACTLRGGGACLREERSMSRRGEEMAAAQQGLQPSTHLALDAYHVRDEVYESNMFGSNGRGV